MGWTEDEFFKNMEIALGWGDKSSAQKLNDEQKQAIQHNIGPLWILAGPGSGKTEVLVWKLLKLVLVHDIEPKSIFITTFTEKAASNMLTRVLLYYNKLVKSGFSSAKDIDINSLRIGTLHSLCNTILSESRYENFHAKRLMDESETSFFFYRYVKMCRGGKNGPSNDFWDHFLSRIPYNKWSRIQSSKSILFRLTEDLIDINKLESSKINALQDLAVFYEQYQEILEEKDRCDYATIQKIFLKFLNDSEGKEFVQGNKERDIPPIRYILVDEYQDTNPIQEEIYLQMTELIKSKEHNLTVVGDDDQSLYRFRGATVESLINFSSEIEKRFKKKPTKIQLKHNYRSHKVIVDWLNSFIQNMPEMKKDGARAPNKEPMISAKQFVTDWMPIRIISGGRLKDVANKVANLISNILNNPANPNNPIVKDPSQIAILSYSTRESSRYVGPLVDELKQRNIKVYNPRNRKIHETSEIKQLIGAFVEIIDETQHENLTDDDVVRISNDVKEFVQSCRVEYCKLLSSNVNTDELERYVRVSQKKIFKAKENEKFDATFHRIFLRLINCPPFSDYLSDPVISPRIGILSSLMEGYSSIYQFKLQKSSTNNKSIKRNRIGDFYNVYCGQILIGGLNDFEDREYPIVPDHVQIMTYHQAKGLEFPFVILLSIRKKPKPGFSHSLETLFCPYRTKEVTLMLEEDRAIQDYVRMYYVGQSRAKYGLIFADINFDIWTYSLGYDNNGDKRNDINRLIYNGIPYDG